MKLTKNTNGIPKIVALLFCLLMVCYAPHLLDGWKEYLMGLVFLGVSAWLIIQRKIIGLIVVCYVSILKFLGGVFFLLAYILPGGSAVAWGGDDANLLYILTLVLPITIGWGVIVFLLFNNWRLWFYRKKI